jgi:long-subunit acyl-CoA synthetase (AMP-forming)
VETGRELGPNTVGEMCFKSPSIMKGYYGNKKATDDMIDSEGWLHTGN